MPHLNNRTQDQQFILVKVVFIALGIIIAFSFIDSDCPL